VPLWGRRLAAALSWGRRPASPSVEEEACRAVIEPVGEGSGGAAGSGRAAHGGRGCARGSCGGAATGRGRGVGFG
jgi:hypothetical protein